MADPVVAPQASEIEAAAGAQPSSAISRAPAVGWTTAVLAMVAFLGAVDRQSFSALLVPIQKELHANDAGMGLLTGSAFALIYAFVALPLARLADRTNRRNLIAIAIALWSTATAASGIVRGFIPLLLVRIGVGGAESAQGPATMSMVADLVPHHRRGAQFSLISFGAASGFALGGLIAGILNDHFGWRAAMLVVGAPGLVLALVMYLTVREPVRGAQDGIAHNPGAGESLGQSLLRCARIRSLYPFAAGFFLLSLAQSGWLIWMPAFLMRVHHLSATKMGAVFGGIVFSGAVGVLAGGPLSDRMAKRGPRWRLYYCCISLALGSPFLAASTLTPGLLAGLACAYIYAFINAGNSPATVAAYLSVAPASIRGMVTAMMNILGLGLGGGLAPVIFGAVNDVLRRSYGDQSLRYTLLLGPASLALAGVMFFIASRFVDRDAQLVSVSNDP